MTFVGELMRKLEQLSGEGLPEDLRITVIIDLSTKDLREHLEQGTKETSCNEVRDEIVADVERKRDFGSQVKDMEVNRFGHNQWEEVRRREGYHIVGEETPSRGIGVTITMARMCESFSLLGEFQGSLIRQRKKGNTFSSVDCGNREKGKGIQRLRRRQKWWQRHLRDRL